MIGKCGFLVWVSLNDGYDENSGEMCAFGNKRQRNRKRQSITDNLETRATMDIRHRANTNKHNTEK